MLGRAWHYETGPNKIKGTSTRAAVIDFSSRDSDVKSFIPDIISWLRKVKLEGERLKPGSCEEMFPNMTNKESYPWNKAKMQIALKIGEPTLLWSVGPEIRSVLLDKGIKDIRKANFEQLDIPDHYKNKKSIEAFFNMNFKQAQTLCNKESARDLTVAVPARDNLEFFLDFETIGEFLDLPNMIFQIGLGWRRKDDKETCYESFIADEASWGFEVDLVEKWLTIST